MSVKTRCVSLVAAGALAAGTLAMAPAPARAATSPAASAVYDCRGNGGLADVSVPLTLTLQNLTDGLTAGTPIQPVLNSALGQAGSALTQLFKVLDSILAGILSPVTQLLDKIFGPIGGSKAITAQVANLELQLVNGVGGVVSKIGATLRGATTLEGLSSNNPLSMLLGNLGSGFTAPIAGSYDLKLPSTFNVGFLGDTVESLACTVKTVGGAVATVVDGKVTLARVTAVSDPGNTTIPNVSPNACAEALPKVGSKKTTLKVKATKKKVKATKNAKVKVTSTYKIKKGKKKVTKKAKGWILVCQGATALGYAKVKGSTTVTLPKLAVGKHRLTVRFLGGGKAKAAAKKVTVKITKR